MLTKIGKLNKDKNMIDIQITWYNLLAFVAGIYFLVEIIIAGKTERKGEYLPLSDLTSVIYIICAIVFYAIFGGIFWW